MLCLEQRCAPSNRSPSSPATDLKNGVRIDLGISDCCPPPHNTTRHAVFGPRELSTKLDESRLGLRRAPLRLRCEPHFRDGSHQITC